MTRTQVVDAYFMEHRARLLDVAAFLDRIDRYKATRDFPATKGPSYLSVHLRFGTISIRRLAREAHARGGAGAETWLNELIWRDFYFQILWHNPRVLNGFAGERGEPVKKCQRMVLHMIEEIGALQYWLPQAYEAAGRSM